MVGSAAKLVEHRNMDLHNPPAFLDSSISGINTNDFAILKLVTGTFSPQSSNSQPIAPEIKPWRDCAM